MSDYNVLDLFAGLGGFSSAFADSDRWDVTTVEIEERFNPDIQADIFDLRPSDFATEYDVVLASPPCEKFSFAGNHNMWDSKRQKPIADEAADYTALAHHAVGLIKGLAPRYWFLENPNGRINWILDRDPQGIVTYCQYGEDYFKQTFLYGEHPPMPYHSCSHTDTCHDTTPQRDGGTCAATHALPDTYSERSLVPYKLSKAIRDACEAGLDGDVAEQSGLEAFD